MGHTERPGYDPTTNPQVLLLRQIVAHLVRPVHDQPGDCRLCRMAVAIADVERVRGRRDQQGAS